MGPGDFTLGPSRPPGTLHRGHLFFQYGGDTFLLGKGRERHFEVSQETLWHSLLAHRAREVKGSIAKHMRLSNEKVNPLGANFRPRSYDMELSGAKANTVN
jgi:hypothetical protein